MSDDVASLTLRVDTGQVKGAADALDDLTNKSKKAEDAVEGLGNAAGQLGGDLHDAQAEAYKLWRANNQVAASARDAGLSIGQYKNSVRGLPAQFTDIAVSLQGGQSPFTVLLQQGGQIVDMFGGSVTGALKAMKNTAVSMGTAILGAINPVTVAITAAGAAALYGYSKYKEQAQAAEELEKAHKKLKDTVNITADELKALADKSGESLSEMVTQLNRVAGDPVKGMEELSAATGDVTLATYEAARALQESGDKAGAMKLYVEELGKAKTDYKAIADNFGQNEVSWWRQIINETGNAISKLREYMIEKNKVKMSPELKAKIGKSSSLDLSFMEYNENGFQTPEQQQQQERQAKATNAVIKMTLDTLKESQAATKKLQSDSVEASKRINAGFMSNISAVDRYKEKLKQAKKDRDAIAAAGGDTKKADMAISGLEDSLAKAEKTAAGHAKKHHATKVKLTETEKERLRVERAIQRAEEQSAAAAKRRQQEVDRALDKAKEKREALLSGSGLSTRNKKLNEDIAGINGDNRYTRSQKDSLIQSKRDDMEAEKKASDDLLGGMSTGFQDTVDEMRNTAAQGAQLAGSFLTGINDQFVQLFTTGKASVKDFATTILQQITKIAMNKAITGIFDMFGGGGGGGGGWGSIFGSFTKMFANANGGAYSGGNLSAFSGQIVSQPTAFSFGNRFANGAGLMGEAGPEAIMPLQRGANGKLGIAATGGGGGGVSVSTNVTVNADGTATADTQSNADNGKQLGDMMNAAALRVIKQQLKSGGLLAKA